MSLDLERFSQGTFADMASQISWSNWIKPENLLITGSAVWDLNLLPFQMEVIILELHEIKVILAGEKCLERLYPVM